jgi:hypothetical protein
MIELQIGSGQNVIPRTPALLHQTRWIIPVQFHCGFSKSVHSTRTEDPPTQRKKTKDCQAKRG